MRRFLVLLTTVALALVAFPPSLEARTGHPAFKRTVPIGEAWVGRKVSFHPVRDLEMLEPWDREQENLFYTLRERPNRVLRSPIEYKRLLWKAATITGINTLGTEIAGVVLKVPGIDGKVYADISSRGTIIGMYFLDDLAQARSYYIGKTVRLSRGTPNPGAAVKVLRIDVADLSFVPYRVQYQLPSTKKVWMGVRLNATNYPYSEGESLIHKLLTID